MLLQLYVECQKILAEDCNVNVFLDAVMREREYKEFNEVKLSLHKLFCKEIEFKNYLQGVGHPQAHD